MYVQITFSNLSSWQISNSAPAEFQTLTVTRNFIHYLLGSWPLDSAVSNQVPDAKIFSLSVA